MKTVQIFLNDLTETSQVTCPYCEKSKFIPNTKLRVMTHALRAKCICENVFELVVNRRCFPRQQVQLKGVLFRQGTRERLAEIAITSLSVGGIGILVEDLTLHIGDVFTVLFRLDNPTKTVVHEDIVIRNVHGNIAGTEFLEQGNYNFDLDFYLMPLEPDG